MYSAPMRASRLASLVFGVTLHSVLLGACGGDDDSGGKANCALPSGAETASEACQECVESSCSAEYASYCSADCGSDMSSSACRQATTKALSCVLQSCSNECVSGSGSGGAGSVDIPNGRAGEAPAGSGDEPDFACYVEEQNLCSTSIVPEGERDTYESACADSGGVVSASCPSADLVGCCHYAGTTTCAYGASPALDADRCDQSGGSWSEEP
jgi:hypothetical protein